MGTQLKHFCGVHHFSKREEVPGLKKKSVLRWSLKQIRPWIPALILLAPF